MNFRYCPRCGGKLVKKDFSLLICGQCDYHFYLNPKPANAAILENEKGEILLTKRKYPPKEGWWDLPGGFVNPNETFEESVKRELKEELGVSIDHISYFSSYYDRYRYQGINYYAISCTFVGKLQNQALIPTDDVSGIRFFLPGAIPFERLAFKSMKQALKDYLKERESNGADSL